MRWLRAAVSHLPSILARGASARGRMLISERLT
jgi:hypothetical protein